MSKPFRVKESAQSPASAEQTAVPPLGPDMVNHPLPAAEQVAGHSQTIPWSQPAPGVSHKPMKGMR